MSFSAHFSACCCWRCGSWADFRKRLALGYRMLRAEVIVASSGAAIMKRIINGFEVDWASERVFAEQQTAPNYGYLFEVSADRKRIVRCAHISATGGDTDNPDRD